MLFSLSDLNKRVVLNSDGKTVCEIGFGEKIKISLLDMCNLRCLLISVQFSLILQSHPTLCDPTDCSTPGLPVYHKLLEFTQTHVHWVGDAIQCSHPLSSPSPPAFNLSQHQGLFQWVGSSHQVATVLKFSFNISTYNEYSGLISLRTDWLDLLAVQRTLKSLLQQHGWNASFLQRSAFFIVQFKNKETRCLKKYGLYYKIQPNSNKK